EWLQVHSRVVVALASKRMAATTAVILVVLGTQLVPMQEARALLAEEFLLNNETAEVISLDEAKVVEFIATELPTDAVVLGHPWTGAGLIYALTGRQVLFTHVGGN